MSRKACPANQDTGDDISNFGHEEQTLALTHHRVRMLVIKVAAISHPLTTGTPSASTEEEPARWRFCCSVLSLGLLYAGQDEAQLLLKPVDYQGWCNLGGGVLDIVLLSTFGVWSCGFISLAISLQLQIAPLTGSIPVLFGLQIISTIY